MTLTAPAAMVGASLAFAAMGVFAKLASAHYSAWEMVFYRSVVSAALMAMIARRLGSPLRTQRVGAHLMRSGVGVVSMWLWFFSLGALPLSTAVTLNYLSSVWLAVFALVGAVLGVAASRRIDPRQLLAVLGGFVGVALVLQPAIAHDQWLGGLAGLVAGVLSAVAYTQVGALGRAGEPETRIVFYFALAGIVFGGIAAHTTGWHAHTPAALGWLAGMAVTGSLGQWLLTRAYSRGGTLVIASLQYLGIVFSTAFGIVLFGETIGWPGLSGIALIMACGVLATHVVARPVAHITKP